MRRALVIATALAAGMALLPASARGAAPGSATPGSATPGSGTTPDRQRAAPAVIAAGAIARRGPPNFVSVCTYDHSLPDDPIVRPGQPGASHLHDFFGNTGTDAFSTHASLVAGRSTCRIRRDTAAYWVPRLYDDGVSIEPRLVRAYYRTGAKDPSTIRAFPAGLKVVATDQRAVRWACIGRKSDGEGQRTVPTCPTGQFLVARITFPDCWDGTNLDSADHASHMSYSRRRGCPPSHPVPVPALTTAVRYPGSDGGNVTLAAGSAPHADFFNAWDQATLTRLVVQCLNARVHCGDRPPAA